MTVKETNSEEEYPEVKTLGYGEIFLESIYVVKESIGKRVPIKQVMNKKSLSAFLSVFKREQNVDDIYVMYISK